MSSVEITEGVFHEEKVLMDGVLVLLYSDGNSLYALAETFEGFGAGFLEPGKVHGVVLDV